MRVLLLSIRTVWKSLVSSSVNRPGSVSSGTRMRSLRSPFDVTSVLTTRTPKLPRTGMAPRSARSEEHTSELASLMRISYPVFCLQKKTKKRKPARAHHRPQDDCEENQITRKENYTQ